MWNVDCTKFLDKEWPKLVEASGEKPKPATGQSIEAAFACWGRDVPKDISQLLGPLEKNGSPKLEELVIGSDVPKMPKGNVAEQRLLLAQKYLPLWKEIFGGLIEIGSAFNGDIWMYGVDPTKDDRSQIYLFNHETDEIDPPQAKDLDSFMFRATLVAAYKASSVTARHELPKVVQAKAIDKKEFDKARKRLEKHAGTTFFDDAMQGVTPYAGDEMNYRIDLRAAWLVKLLSTDNVSDREIRGNFVAKSNLPLTAKLVKERAKHLDFPPVAFYLCWTAFFSGDEKLLKLTLDLCRKSKAPLVKDLAALMDELQAGRKELGVVRDIQELRRRVIALKLWEPRDPHAKPTAAETKSATDAARKGALDELAWASVEDRGVLKAIEAEWLKDKTLGASLKLFSATIRKKDGYIDDRAQKTFLENGDRRLTPLLVGHALDEERGYHNPARNILAGWADPRSVSLVAPLLKTVNRFQLERFFFIRLVRNVGDAANTKYLLDLLKRVSPHTKDANEKMMLANVMVALAMLGDASVGKGVLPYLGTTGKDDGQGQHAPLALQESVMFALGKLGVGEALPMILKANEDSRVLSSSAGARFALGYLAARENEKPAKNKVISLLRAIKSNEDFFDDDVMGRRTDVAREIALELALTRLGDSDAALRALVTKVLSVWSSRVEAGNWSGYDSHTLLCWSLIALHELPAIGVELAKPFVDSSIDLARYLARSILDANQRPSV